MLNTKLIIRKLLWLFCLGNVLFFVSNANYANETQQNESKLKGKKTAWELITEAQISRKIDEDMATLYRFYYYYGYRDLLPKEFVGIVIPWESDIIFEPAPFLAEVWNNLRPETKQEIKRARWDKSLYHEKKNPTVKITQPQDIEVVYSPEVVVKGQIKTPEIYELTSAWIEVSAKGSGGKRQEIHLSQPNYISAEDAFEDERGKKYYLETKKRYKDKPGLAEVFGPPGKKVYNFSETLTLSSTGIWRINITAQNTSSGAGTESVSILYPEKEDKDPPIVNVRYFKNGSLSEEIYDGDWIDTLQVFVNRIISDDKETLGGLYINDKLWCGIGKGHCGSMVNLNYGKNTLRVVVTDGHNVVKKNMRIYVKEK